MKTTRKRNVASASASTKPEPTIFTLSIECVSGMYWEWPFRRVFEVHQDLTLAEVAWLIMEETGFEDGDHGSTFFIGTNYVRSYGWVTKTGEWAKDGSDVDEEGKWETRLSDLFPLPSGKKIFYWYDFGDDWKFEIRKIGRAHPPVPRRKYPRLIEKEGRKPIQYPRYD